MRQDKIDIIKSYIETNVAPILIDKVPLTAFPSAIVLEANCGINDLNGHYEGADFVPPIWYNQLLNVTDSKKVLIINGIDTIDLDEQSKFIEILKYRKVSTFDLPDNTVIILLVSEIENKISPEINANIAIIEV